MINQVMLENFRCFREKQEVRLAPLTLLVGDNSTGKTSFMAMIRALWDIACRDLVPDFKEEPYDLGSFDEIAHYRGGKAGRAKEFIAGFDTTAPGRSGKKRSACFRAVFEKDGTTPFPVKIHLSYPKVQIEKHRIRSERGAGWQFVCSTERGSWRLLAEFFAGHSNASQDIVIPPFDFFRYLLEEKGAIARLEPLGKSPKITASELKKLRAEIWDRGSFFGRALGRVYAGAPVRSKPKRTYDPARLSRDPEGDYVPMYLADMYFQDRRTWDAMKDDLNQFGKEAGLFDEIAIKELGKKGDEPFQVQIRKSGGKRKGPMRNLVDVGYGVNQVLPVITEMLREEAPSTFLLQQPEIHLHPSAQAALGSLFCKIAKTDRQLIVETHSDHLLDRVRMNIRDGTTKLTPDDVSILFFERKDLEVHIHPIRIDKEGNINGAPTSYRKFFMEETARSLQLA